jgi:hypothetical protein
MPTSSARDLPSDSDPKFAVGWQKLTTDEFLEALASAVLEKVQSLKSGETEKANDVMTSPVDHGPKSAQDL